MTGVAQTLAVTLRGLRALMRQPWFVAITLVQPLIWLLLFGALFESATDIPGFDDDSYVDFLVPGVVVMTALFSAGWNGMGFVDDIDRGVLDRFLVTPVWRTSLNLGSVLYAAVVIAVQSLVVVAVGLAIGARFPSVLGVAVLVGVAALVGMSVASLSNGLGLLTRQQETLIGAVQLVILPLTFLSSAFMQLDLAPGWVEEAGRFNPANWAVDAGRAAVSADPDWGLVGTRVLLLAALLVLCSAFATRAFRSYARSA
jgi:ABC-2 type transport system permease protein